MMALLILVTPELYLGLVLQQRSMHRCPTHRLVYSGCSIVALSHSLLREMREEKGEHVMQRALLWQDGKLGTNASKQAIHNALQDPDAVIWLDLMIENNDE